MESKDTAKLRFLNKTDYDRMRTISKTLIISRGGVGDTKGTIFDPLRSATSKVGKFYEAETDFTRFSKIEFGVPVINPLFSNIGERTDAISRLFKAVEIIDFFGYTELFSPYILEEYKNNPKSIMIWQFIRDLRYIYDLNTGKIYDSEREVGISSLLYKDCLMGASLFRFLCSKINIKPSIERIIKGLLYEYKVCTQKFASEAIVLHSEIPGGENIIDDIWVKCVEKNPGRSKPMYDAIRRALVSFTRIGPYQLKKMFYNNRAYFDGIVMEYFVAPPYGYIEPFKDTFKPLGKLANELMKISETIKSNIEHKTACKFQTVKGQIKRLVSVLADIMIKGTVKSSSGGFDYKSIISELSAKKGPVKRNALGVRTDYSSQAVITINPQRKLGYIGVPYQILVKIWAPLIMKKTKILDGTKITLDYPGVREAIMEIATVDRYLVLFGRPPSLHKLSIQAMYVEPIEGEAIDMAALGVSAFNADFDGDKMGIYALLNEDSQAELRAIHLFNNMRIEKDGTYHTLPRHEIIFGLSKIPDMVPKSVAYKGTKDIDEMLGLMQNDGSLCLQEICGMTVLQYILKEILNVKTDVKGVKVNNDFIGKHLDKFLPQGGGVIANKLDQLTRLGLIVVKFFPIALNITDNIDKKGIEETFDSEVIKLKKRKALGLITEETYKVLYKKIFMKFDQSINAAVKRYINETGSDGFSAMCLAKARCSESNIKQIFGSTGIISKSAHENFSINIKKPLSGDLTSLEHFGTAFSGRKGVVDKVVETSKPGHLTRLEVHSSSGAEITSRDCGTKLGIPLTLNRLAYYSLDELTNQFMSTQELSSDEEEKVLNLFRKITFGRTIITKSGNQKTIDREDTCDEIFKNNVKKDGYVLMRSPITCSNPCCAVCYGPDLSSNELKLPSNGRRIGYSAALSVTEPSTQLTMKNFQSGVVTGQVNLTTAFDDIKHMWRLESINFSSVVNTNPLAEEDDYITRTKTTNHLFQITTGRKTILSSTCDLRSKIQVGEPIFRRTAPLDVKEVRNCRGAVEAAIEQMFAVYRVYMKEIDVAFKHFEVIFSELLFYAERGDAGKSYNLRNLTELGKEFPIELTEDLRLVVKDLYIDELLGVSRAFYGNPNAIKSIFTENIKESIIKAILLKKIDSFTDPMVRRAFGQRKVN